MRVETQGNIKLRFKTREGVYQKLNEFGVDNVKMVPATVSCSALRCLNMPVVDITEKTFKSSKTKNELGNDIESKSLVYCTGKDVYHYSLSNTETYVDRRSYKGGALPSTLKICQNSASPASLRVAIGFTAGQLQIIDMATLDESRRSLQKINDERTMDNAAITVIQWLPSSSNRLLAANQNGNIYLYNTDKTDCSNFSPIQIRSEDYPMLFTQFENEKIGNPEQKWVVGTMPITSLEFSPDGKKLAVTSRNGYCLILQNRLSKDFSNKLEFDIKKTMKSYFGGFLCSAWSPSGRVLAAGGEDDLITIMSSESGKIICRCQGHRSWLSSISWDPFIKSTTGNIDARLGSVGQDGILCLWELSSDVMFPRRTRTFSESERINAFNARHGIDPKKEEDEITILEPLIEKRISAERLTHLSFHESLFLMASQDKEHTIFVWGRPGSSVCHEAKL